MQNYHKNINKICVKFIKNHSWYRQHLQSWSGDVIWVVSNWLVSALQVVRSLTKCYGVHKLPLRLPLMVFLGSDRLSQLKSTTSYWRLRRFLTLVFSAPSRTTAHCMVDWLRVKPRLILGLHFQDLSTLKYKIWSWR